MLGLSCACSAACLCSVLVPLAYGHPAWRSRRPRTCMLRRLLCVSELLRTDHMARMLAGGWWPHVLISTGAAAAVDEAKRVHVFPWRPSAVGVGLGGLLMFSPYSSVHAWAKSARRDSFTYWFCVSRLLRFVQRTYRVVLYGCPRLSPLVSSSLALRPATLSVSLVFCLSVLAQPNQRQGCAGDAR